MSKKKKTEEAIETAVEGTTSLHVLSLVRGQMVQANDGGFYRVVTVDPVLDPRSGVYESETNEALVRFERGESVGIEVMKGHVRILAA